MAQTTRLWAEIQAWLDRLDFPPSQRRLAKALDVSPNAVSEWKLGQSKPSPENLNRLALLMAPVVGREVHERLLVALLEDMGYDVGSNKRQRGVLAGYLRHSLDQLDGPLSEPPDTIPPAMAADHQEQSIAGESEESDTP